MLPFSSSPLSSVDDDQYVIAERLNSADVRLNELSRRPLGSYEVERLTREWRTYRSSIGEPLHVWLGWTEAELYLWQTFGRLPNY